MDIQARDGCSRWVSQQQPFFQWMSNSSRLANELTTTLPTSMKIRTQKFRKNQNKKPTHPLIKIFTHTNISWPKGETWTLNPETWTQETKGENWTHFFHPKIILYNTSIVKTNLCFSKKKMFFKRKLNSVLFFIFKIKTSLQKI